MLKLRDHQVEVVEKIRQGFSNGHRCQLLYAPTGFGKTEVAMAIMKAVSENYKKTAMVMDRIVLVDQTSQRLDKYGIDHGVMQSTHWRHRPTERIQICSAQTLEKRKNFPDINLLIIDECHIARRGVNKFIKDNPHIKVIGLTASPFTKGLGSIYTHIVGAKSTGDLVTDGWLCPLRVFIAKEIDMEGANKVAGEWSADDVSDRGIKITGDIVTEWEKKTFEIYGKPAKTIVFCSGVAHGRHLKEKFAEHGYRFESISYKEDDEFKKEMIEEFSKPDSQIVGLIATDILTRGFDVTDVMIGVSARPFSKSFSSHVQQLGRVMRSHPGKEFGLWLDHCIASGQRVLTHRGLVPIELILLSDKIWDGHDFVSHKGVVSRGKRPVIRYAGLTATADHLVKTRDEGWCSFGYCAEKQKAIITTGIGRTVLWERDDCFTSSSMAWSEGTKSYARALRVHNLWLSFNNFIDKLAEWKNKRLSSMQSTKTSARVVKFSSGCDESEMQKSEEFRLRKLWWKGNRVQIRLSDFLRSLDSRELGIIGGVQSDGLRQDRQQWSLRGWESEIRAEINQQQQSQNFKMGTVNAQVYAGTSRNKICRKFIAIINGVRSIFRSNSRKILQEIQQTEREVWDILDCGPRNSFTCEGLLVHNSGNYIRFKDDWDNLYEEGVSKLSEGGEKAKTEPTEKKKSELKCPSCSALWTSKTDKCDNCGHIRKRASSIINLEGELEELAVSNAKLAINPQDFYSELLYYARLKGIKDGWAYYKVREKFGVFPRGLLPVSKEPTTETLKWIKSRAIVFRKGQEKLARKDIRASS